MCRSELVKVNFVNLCTAPERRDMKEWFDTAALSPLPNSGEPRLFMSPQSDLRETNNVASVSHKSPARSSSSVISSPAAHGSRLQQLENYETHHGRQSLRKPLFPWESPSPGRRSSESSSSDVNNVSTPTSHRLNTKLALVRSLFFVVFTECF